MTWYDRTRCYCDRCLTSSSTLFEFLHWNLEVDSLAPCFEHHRRESSLSPTRLASTTVIPWSLRQNFLRRVFNSLEALFEHSESQDMSVNYVTYRISNG
jgi:hypothetical protein